jgi:hypothetical protein
MSYQLRFRPGKIPDLAKKYSYGDQTRETRIVNEIGQRVRSIGFYTKADFLELCYWKSPRTQPSCERNDEAYIEEITKIALGTQHERLRIEALTLLDGVGWPTASVMLHFGHREPYPILDFRALWSLEIDLPSSYDFEFWWDYVVACRDLATRYGLDMRTLDRTLWQYSKENQKQD